MVKHALVALWRILVDKAFLRGSCVCFMMTLNVEAHVFLACCKCMFTVIVILAGNTNLTCAFFNQTDVGNIVNKGLGSVRLALSALTTTGSVAVLDYDESVLAGASGVDFRGLTLFRPRGYRGQTLREELQTTARQTTGNAHSTVTNDLKINK